MKICPKCNTSHSNNGVFCSRSCSNSRNFSIESKQKKREANKKFYATLSVDDRINRGELLRSKYDYAGQQIRAKQTKIDTSWSRPYEEMSRESLRKRLLHERNNRCEECGQTNIWNGKPLSLEMDHIDGNPKNNVIGNLRILCPHCHSQTDTFRAKNIKGAKDRINIVLLTEALIKYKFATPALTELGLPNSPSRMKIANKILAELKANQIIP